MNQDNGLLRLACHYCGWRPHGELTMGVFAAHVETEHPEALKADGELDIQMDMVVVCPRCEVVAPLTRTEHRPDGQLCIHDCPACHRTYRVPMNEQPS